jgi:cupin fold WbuC family metalloprotein
LLRGGVLFLILPRFINCRICYRKPEMIIINKKLSDSVVAHSVASERRRSILNFHTEPVDPIQRMINALQPETYVRPHKHESPDKREVFLILEGSIAILIFDDDGKITDMAIMNRNSGVYGVEIPARTWHALVSLEANSVLYEIKDGPYNPADDKVFALWSPEEGSAESEKTLKNWKAAIAERSIDISQQNKITQ